jgi:exopolysaccharide production protein ExoQ
MSDYATPTRQVGAPWRSGRWWLACGAAVALVLSIEFGTVAAGGFMLLWVVYIAAYPARAMSDILCFRLPLLLPCIALLSVVWSDDQSATLRMGLELLLTAIGGSLAAQMMPARQFLSSVFVAVFFGVLVSFVSGNTAAVDTEGDLALVGIFSTKNVLAEFAGLLLILAAAVGTDRLQPTLFRALAVVGGLVAPTVLVLARSAGGLATAAAAASVTLGLVGLSRLGPRRRAVVAAGVVVVLACGAASLAADGGQALSAALEVAGKDTSLTGRTYLWDTARVLIAERPTLGRGYQSFWRHGNVEAEGLWREFKIKTRTGFHFHNLYYQTEVELGYCGFAALLGMLCISVVTSAGAAFTRPGNESACLFGILLFFVMRSFLEIDVLYPFTVGQYLWSAVLVYSLPLPRRRGVARHVEPLGYSANPGHAGSSR